ncbi:hypothetical protein LZ023_39400 (plasmid) [Pseudomonas silvicola]|nr:hypothetical protein LZ023_39400 [Pseudomonas silvicola]
MAHCRIERFPGVSSWESLEHIGPMTHGARQRMSDVSDGRPGYARSSLHSCSDVNWISSLEKPLNGLRIAFSADFGYIAVDKEVRDVVTKSRSTFARELGRNRRGLIQMCAIRRCHRTLVALAQIYRHAFRCKANWVHACHLSERHAATRMAR